MNIEPSSLTTIRLKAPETITDTIPKQNYKDYKDKDEALQYHVMNTDVVIVFISFIAIVIYFIIC
jgi:hypothetical protein